MVDYASSLVSVMLPNAQAIIHRETPVWSSFMPVNVRVSVVIPALNEAKNLPHVLPRIPSWVHEVILIPGHSTDDTIEVAQALWPSVRIVEQERRGKGAALRSGFAAATGEIIVMLDADGSMDPGEIPSFVGLLLTGVDFVKGTRFMQGGGTSDMEFYRKFGNWSFTVIANILFGGNFSDLCYGYNAFWRRILPHLNLDGDGFEIETMMNLRALYRGFKVAEVPSFEAARVHGMSNLQTIPDGWRVLKTLVRERLKQQVKYNAPSTSNIVANSCATIGNDDKILAEREVGGG